MASSTCDGENAFEIEDKTILKVKSGYSCVQVPSYIEVIEYGTESSYAFQQSADIITQIDFSKATSLKEIGNFSFYKCTEVKYLDLSSCSNLESIGAMAFASCSSCESIKLPEQSQLTIIPGGCFSKCSSLTSFTLPETIEVIENVYKSDHGAFGYCNNLVNFTFGGEKPKIKIIGEKAFMNISIETLDIPASLEYIEGNSFRQCLNLREINVNEDNLNYSSCRGILLDKTKTKLIYYPNLACEGTTAILPECVKEIDKRSFMGNKQYNSVNLTGVTTIHGYAFERAENITDIVIPSSVKAMGNRIFNLCQKLVSVVFECSIETIPEHTFSSCTQLVNVTLPEGLKKIDRYAFYKCSNLTEIIIPKSVKEIEFGAFTQCDLRSIYLADTNITTFTGHCFSKNPHLSQIVFPSYFETIEKNSFSGCSPNAFVYYFGVNVIDLNAGFPSTAKAIVSNSYKSPSFLKLKAYTSFQATCTPNNGHISYGLTLISIALYKTY